MVDCAVHSNTVTVNMRLAKESVEYLKNYSYNFLLQYIDPTN